MKASAFVATSLDGFIARLDGSLDWLGVPEENEDYGFAAFMDGVDALIMGRNTYDIVWAMDVWPYGHIPVIVLTNRPIDIPGELAGSVEASSLAPAELISELEARGMSHAYIDGGRVIQSFLGEGLIDRIIITTIPILIGDGIPLFGTISEDIHLRHVDTVAYINGLVQSTYEVV